MKLLRRLSSASSKRNEKPEKPEKKFVDKHQLINDFDINKIDNN